MRELIVSILIITSVIVELSSQSIVEPSYLIIGRDALPMNGEAIIDSFLFYDESQSAFRGGLLLDDPSWSPDSLGLASIAWGYNTRALEDYGIALGFSTKASGTQASTALGYSTTASGHQGATALGHRTVASGSEGATALGRSTVASGSEGATALGSSTLASGSEGATALGSLTIASGSEGATALGYRSEATGVFGSTALGRTTLASGNFGATALGSNTFATGNSCLSVGTYNDSIVASETILSPLSPLFIVGNGDAGSGNESNAMVIQKNGNIGIGTNSPQSLIDVQGANQTELILSDFEDQVNIQLSTIDQGNDLWEISAKATVNGTPTERASIIFQYGQDSLFRIKGDGNATIAGTLSENSDIRLKKNIQPLSDVLSQLLDIGAYTYNWKDEEKNKARQIGLIAQEVQAQFPELVQKDKNGMLSVSYSRLVPLLLQGMKEQEQRISKLEKLITQLVD